MRVYDNILDSFPHGDMGKTNTSGINAYDGFIGVTEGGYIKLIDFNGTECFLNPQLEYCPNGFSFILKVVLPTSNTNEDLIYLVHYANDYGILVKWNSALDAVSVVVSTLTEQFEAIVTPVSNVIILAFPYYIDCMSK